MSFIWSIITNFISSVLYEKTREYSFAIIISFLVGFIVGIGFPLYSEYDPLNYFEKKTIVECEGKAKDIALSNIPEIANDFVNDNLYRYELNDIVITMGEEAVEITGRIVSIDDSGNSTVYTLEGSGVHDEGVAFVTYLGKSEGKVITWRGIFTIDISKTRQNIQGYFLTGGSGGRIDETRRGLFSFGDIECIKK